MVIKVASGEFDHCHLVTLTTAEFERFTSLVVSDTFVSDTDVLYYFSVDNGTKDQGDS